MTAATAGHQLQRMTLTSSPAPTALREPRIFAGWLVRIGFVLLLGSSALAARLIWEQTVWSWEQGPQMVGFSLVHGSGVFLLLFPLLLVCWLLIAVMYLLLHWRNRGLLWWTCLIATALSAVPLGLCSLPYGFWQRLFVERLSNGPYAGQFFVHAAAVGDLATVETFVAHGLPLNIRNRRGQTALHGAAVQGHTKVIQYLISAGADVNSTDRMGHSPLHIATSEHHEESAKLLADHGAVTIEGIEARGKKLIDEQMKENFERMGLRNPQPTERSGTSTQGNQSSDK